MSLEHWKKINKLPEVSLGDVRCKVAPKDLKTFAIHPLEDSEPAYWLPIARYAQEDENDTTWSVLYKNVVVSSTRFGQYKVLTIYMKSGDNVLRDVDDKEGKRSYEKWI